MLPEIERETDWSHIQNEFRFQLAGRLKPGISFEQAAGVPLAATTAWQALIDTAKLKSGQTVLIHGGSGGVGHFAIQIAKAKARK